MESRRKSSGQKAWPGQTRSKIQDQGPVAGTRKPVYQGDFDKPEKNSSFDQDYEINSSGKRPGAPGGRSRAPGQGGGKRSPGQGGGSQSSRQAGGNQASRQLDGKHASGEVSGKHGFGRGGVPGYPGGKKPVSDESALPRPGSGKIRVFPGAVQESGPRTMVEGRISGLNHEGDGLLHAGDLMVAVARTAPGDQVRVSVPKDAVKFVHGDLSLLVHGGPGRVNPSCQSFVAGCGGCQWLHLSPKVQGEEKSRMVKDALGHIKGIVVRPLLSMEKPWEFRNKLSLENRPEGLVFMQDFNGQKVVPPSCRAQTKALDMLWDKLRELHLSKDVLQVHLRAADAGSIGVCFHVKAFTPGVHQAAKLVKALGPAVVGVGALCKEEFRLLMGKPFLEHRTLGTRYRIPLAGFFQTNYAQARVLLQETIKILAPGPDDRVLDLYCGGGYFSLPVAREAREVMGIEANPASVEMARQNAQLNGITNTCFVASDVAKALGGMEAGAWPLVMLDPPRSGCEEEVLRQVLRLAPRRMVYISCSPRSLGRDLEIFCAGGYAPTWCQPLDMFPHSFHVETLVCLERRAE